MRYVLLLLTLAACGSATGLAGDGYGGGGLVVLAAGRPVGILLDVSEETGVWKVWSTEQRVVFRIDPDTGVIDAAQNSAYFASNDCSGEPFVTGGQVRCVGLSPGRLLSVIGGNAAAGTHGSRVLITDGAALVAMDSHSKLTGAGCVTADITVCVQRATISQAIGVTMPLPIAAR